MNSFRLVCGLAALTLCTAIQAAPAEYRASVQQAYAANKPLRKIGLAPFECPKELECADLERELIEQLSERTGSTVIDSKAVRSLMTRASVTDLEERESRTIMAEGLGVDAFAFVHVKKVGAGRTTPPKDDKWAHLKRETSVKTASLELRVVDRDGAPLAQVSGDAEVYDSMRSLSTIAGHLFEEMLQRAWR